MPETIEYDEAVRYRRDPFASHAAIARGALATLEWAWHSTGPVTT